MMKAGSLVMASKFTRPQRLVSLKERPATRGPNGNRQAFLGGQDCKGHVWRATRQTKRDLEGATEQPGFGMGLGLEFEARIRRGTCRSKKNHGHGEMHAEAPWLDQLSDGWLIARRPLWHNKRSNFADLWQGFSMFELEGCPRPGTRVNCITVLQLSHLRKAHRKSGSTGMILERHMGKHKANIARPDHGRLIQAFHLDAQPVKLRYFAKKLTGSS